MRMLIDNDCIEFYGPESLKHVYLVIRRNGIEISENKIETILPMYELKLNNNKIEDKELAELLRKEGCCTENEFVFNGETYSYLTKAEE